MYFREGQRPNREEKARHWLERYHFVVSTLARVFRLANQMDGISKAGGDKMAAS